MKFETDYASLCRDLASLTENVPYLIANLANTSALIWERMEGLNWAGFYILTDLDSPYVGRFTENDRQELENLTKIIEAFL